MQTAPEREEEEINSAVDGVSTATAPSFLSRLVTELLRLKFYEKNNDLYQFRQVSGERVSEKVNQWAGSVYVCDVGVIIIDLSKIG